MRSEFVRNKDKGMALIAFVMLIGVTFLSAPLFAGQLYVGGATVSITPEERVALDGMTNLRISEKVESPCTATALAIETRDGEQSLDQAVFVSCDLVGIHGGIFFHQDLRALLKGRVPDFLLPKIVVNATHTHTAPVTEEPRQVIPRYAIPESGIMSPVEYREFLMKRLVEVVVNAWERRAPARVAWGLGHAVVAQNRRAVYANGKAVMYGKTNDPEFRGIEGYEDHGVELLYFWDAENKLIATVINVACPSQARGGGPAVNADFWHEVREQLRKEHGKDLLVLAWCGAAGDQAPTLMYRQAAEERMRRLRGVGMLDEWARRLVSTWEDVYQLVRKDQHDDVELAHRVEVLKLPLQKITAAQANASRKAADAITDPKFRWRKTWFETVVRRFEEQQANDNAGFEMELHAVRLGDVAIVTNDFELFTDYGVQMKARSPALQTFVIQLCGDDTYVPTERAVQGGGYSAVPESIIVGPEGGQVLVEETLKQIKALWPSAK